ncbi:UNVERIFIED_CONTAM: Monothiol glutaredoxin-S6, partial [Trichonephila clavipes]
MLCNWNHVLSSVAMTTKQPKMPRFLPQCCKIDVIENGPQMQKAMAERVGRTSVPQVFIRGQHVGGCDDTMAAHCSGKLHDMLFNEEPNYDYDLIVIGGGSGGLAASK